MTPLYKMLTKDNLNGINVNDLQRRLQQFAQNLKVDPKEYIQRMMASGQLSQEQYNSAEQKARQIMRMLNG